MGDVLRTLVAERDRLERREEYFKEHITELKRQLEVLEELRWNIVLAPGVSDPYVADTYISGIPIRRAMQRCADQLREADDAD